MSTQAERWECPGCGTALNIAGLGIYARVACPACGHVEHVHTTLANFRIEGVLGIGGMSVVLRARDLVLDRPLAIKLLNEYYRDQTERIERFERECELMAKVRHENVVSVYSAGHDRGQFYIAMELLHGRNLEVMVQEDGPMPPAEALRIVRQVVMGLDAAYRAGLLHRDMKPGNIIISEDGRAKVLDFGLSLGTRDEDTEEIIWATPYYVPPETLMREPEDLRTDIYALGMTLRHLLTGREKFTADSSAASPQSIPAMLECKRQLPPMAEEMPGLEEAYSDLVDHMTSFEPSMRPASYASLLVEIDEVQAALAAAGQDASAGNRVRKYLKLAGGVAATLLLGAGLAAGVASWAKPRPVRQYITPSAQLAWREYDTLAAAMQSLQSGNTQEACRKMMELADSDGEPAACAWAALHAGILVGLQDNLRDSDARQRMQQRFAYHLSRTPAPAGRRQYDQMLTLLQPDAAPTDKLLQAALRFGKLEAAAIACREAELRSLMRESREALQALGPAYASLANMLGAVQGALADSLPERANACFAQSLAGLDIGESRRVLAVMESATHDDGQRRRLAVQKEACGLLHEAVEMMKRRQLMPPAGTELGPDELQARLAPLQTEGKLPEELSTLMLVAAGRFDEAAARNPYRNARDSREPFAILMRDWMQRVGK